MQKRADQLRHLLEEEILTGKLTPGERLEEIALAERMGVSRTPIREALLQLAASGLVESRPRRGAVVAEIGPKRLIEMFDVMAELEAMCARLAARRAMVDEIALIRAAHEGCRNVGSGSDAYFYENESFHDAIRQASHNGFLLEQAQALHKRLRPYRRHQLKARNRVENSFAEHGAILEAIEQGEDELASERMRAHISIQGEQVTNLLTLFEQPDQKRI